MPAGYPKDLNLPPVFGGSNLPPADIPTKEKPLTLPGEIGGKAPSMSGPTEKPLELPPTIRMS